MLLNGVSWAELTWDDRKIKLQAKVEEESVRAVFHFKNESQKVCEIISVSSSCGCTVPKLEKQIYQPGEEGAVEAIFTVGSRKGIQNKSMIATVKEGEETRKYKLELQVEILREISFKPSFHFWKRGEANAEKQVLIEAYLPNGVGINEIELSDEAAFAYRLEEVESRKKYHLYIKPKNTDQSARASFELKTDVKLARSGKLKIYAAVK